MSEKNISEMMKAKASEFEKMKLDGNGVLAEREIGREMFSGTSDYSYCPHCARQLKMRFGKEWKAHSSPMWAIRYKLLIKVSNTVGKVIYETRWFCPLCKKTVTEDDFIEVYCSSTTKEPSLVDLTKLNMNDPNFGRYF